jgi:hypothetical protein
MIKLNQKNSKKDEPKIRDRSLNSESAIAEDIVSAVKLELINKPNEDDQINRKIKSLRQIIELNY